MDDFDLFNFNPFSHLSSPFFFETFFASFGSTAGE
jgi:hypothetical protein